MCEWRGGGASRRTVGCLYVSLELIAASGGVDIQVLAELCQKVLDGFRMPVEWALSVVVPIFIAKGGIRNCN